MPLTPDAFYLTDPPAFLQQGDIIAGVPLLLLPPLDYLMIVRSQHARVPIDHLQPGGVELVREQALADAFEVGTEYVVVSAAKVWAVLMTPTCDLEGQDIWAMWPMYPIDAVDPPLDRGNLEAGKYANLYRIPDHSYFQPSLIDLSDFRAVRREQVRLADRIASISRQAQHDLLERFYASVGRPWGFAAGEHIQPLGKHEVGKFRCARCNLYDVVVPEKVLQVGSPAPECENCKKIRKAAQWYPLTHHRKS